MTRGKNNVRLIVAAFFLHNHLGCFRKQAEVNVMASLWCIKGLASLIWLFPIRRVCTVWPLTRSRDKWFSPYSRLFSQSMKEVFYASTNPFKRRWRTRLQLSVVGDYHIIQLLGLSGWTNHDLNG